MEKMSESNRTQLKSEGENINKNQSNDSKLTKSAAAHSNMSEAEIHKVTNAKIAELIGSVEKISLGDDFQCQLDALQCPFTWKMREVLVHRLSKDVITRLEEKEEELDGEEGPFLLLRHCGLQFALCYENWCEGDIAAARERQRICDRLIMESDDSFPCLDGLKHISKSCAVYLSHLSGLVSDTRDLLKTVVPFKELDDVNKACVVGMRGIVLMEYGYEGTSQSVSYIEKALEMDPSSAAWHFLLGKSLRRMRRLNNYNTIPDKRELKALEKAVEMSSCSGYCTFLAQTYRETAFRVYSLNKKNLAPFKGTLDSMNQKAADYYRKSLEKAPESSHINIRCALGFLNLPYPYRDERLAKSCIDKALKLAPTNTMAHHVAGKYFERIGNLEEAKRSYKSSGKYGAYGAYMDYLRLEFKTDHKYDPLPVFNEMLETFKEEPYRVGTLSQIGAYYYLLKNKLKEAVTYWLQIIDENYNTDRLKTYKPVCVFVKEPFDLLQVALDEVQLALLEGNVSSAERALYERLTANFEGTEMLSHPPEAHRQQILEESENVLREAEERLYKPRGRERGGKRGRGNYQENRGGRGRGRGRGSGTGDRGDRGRGYYRSSDRRDSSRESNSSSRRYYSKERYGQTKSWNRDSSCESNSSQKDWRTIRNRKASEGEFSSSPRDHNQREYRRASNYHGSYDRDSSCDSTGSHGSIPGKRGSRRRFQEQDRRYGSSNSFQKGTNFNWREDATVQDSSYERQYRPDYYNSKNRGNWRERPTYSHDECDRGSYGDSARGDRQAYRKPFYNRNRDSSADSSTSDNLGEQCLRKHNNKNFQRNRQDSGSDHTEHDKSSFNRSFKHGPRDEKEKANESISQGFARYNRRQTNDGNSSLNRGKNSGSAGVYATENDGIQQKLRARKEMSHRISDQKMNKNGGGALTLKLCSESDTKKDDN